jgi:hypothetical protein
LEHLHYAFHWESNLVLNHDDHIAVFKPIRIS